MGLSLESIHQPLTDFFLSQFKTDAGSPVLFRFDKFGSVVSDQDFINPNHPELGVVPALAMETFSDLVNHIPVDTGDGMNVLLSADSIDTTYFFHLLSPAVPFLSPGMADAAQSAVIQAFSLIKQNCLKVWNDVTAESLTGLMLQYKPSLATPESWYDSSHHEGWTSHAFEVTQTSPTPASGPPNQLWKLKLNDEVMRKALQLPTAEMSSSEPATGNLPARVLAVRANPIPVAPVEPRPFTHLVATNRIAATGATPLATHAFMMSATDRVADAGVTSSAAHPFALGPIQSTAERQPPPTISVAMHDVYLRQIRDLDVSKRLLVTQYVGQYAPTPPVETNRISISFDYCVVSIRRPWYQDVFMNDRSWCVPNVAKGQVTSSAQPGTLSLLPTEFVAIRNLAIEANWTSADVANAALATDFGPFKVSPGIVASKLTHPGLQIIGWILQKMPDLPPNNPPA